MRDHTIMWVQDVGRSIYYLETRGDVLLRNKEIFRYWTGLGLKYMFLGLEAIDEEGLERYRKRVSLDQNMYLRPRPVQ